ncbi:transposable element Tcb2 transposase [Trichonephila clavipes]|nr:transposable element Tcb2 transposase [Trichonephila clavipes]
MWSLDIFGHWNAKRSSVPYLTYWALNVGWPAFEMVFPYWWTWKETVGGANWRFRRSQKKSSPNSLQADEKLVCYWSSGVGDGQLDGWKWDCLRLMLLDVSMCLVVLFSDFGINTNPKFCVQKTCSRSTTSYNTCRRPFSSSFGTKEKNHYCATARCRPLSSIRKKNLRYYGAKSSSQCRSVCKKTSCVRSPQRTTAKEPLMLGKRTCFLTQQQWTSVLFTDESRFTMESDSGRLLIWREQRTRYHQSNTVERHSYRGGGILVWAGISLGGHTDLHVFHGGTVTGLRYRDEILDPYVRPYAAAIGNYFILMDDNARPHRARIVEEYLEDHGLERMEWPARSPDLNLIEHLWDYLGREVAALNPPPRSLHELKQGLLCVWSSLPIPVSDNLINSMGNRCRQCIQVRGGHIPY